mgnify:CR=1 FL=1
MKILLKKIISLSGIKVNPIKSIYPVKNHLYNSEEDIYKKIEKDIKNNFIEKEIPYKNNHIDFYAWIKGLIKNCKNTKNKYNPTKEIPS